MILNAPPYETANTVRKLCLLLLIALPAMADEERAPRPHEILGRLADGSPAPPRPPVPRLQVEPCDLRETTVAELDGRTITIQRIGPRRLPEPATVPFSGELDEAIVSEARSAARTRPADEFKPVRVLFVSAIVYDHETTFLRWSDQTGEPTLEGWGNVDFNHRRGFSGFTDGQVDPDVS